MKLRTIAAAISLFAAGTALAHQGVQNVTVQARMDGMSAIAANMKTLGSMAKGSTPFDAEKARTATTAIAEHASRIPALFQENETDPSSDAKSTIWDNWDDFNLKTLELEKLALDLSSSFASSNDLRPALLALNATCKSCHSSYRE